MLQRLGMARDDGVGAVLRWPASRARQLEAHLKKLEASFASAESARPAVLPAEKACLWNPDVAPCVPAGSGVWFADERLAPGLWFWPPVSFGFEYGKSYGGVQGRLSYVHRAAGSASACLETGPRVSAV